MKTESRTTVLAVCPHIHFVAFNCNNGSREPHCGIPTHFKECHTELRNCVASKILDGMKHQDVTVVIEIYLIVPDSIINNLQCKMHTNKKVSLYKVTNIVHVVIVHALSHKN